MHPRPFFPPVHRTTPAPSLLPRSAGGGAAFVRYPNPAHRALTEVGLVELLGGAVRQRTALTSETTAVPLVGLKPGTYACQLYVGGVWQSSQRVVIE